MGFSCFARKTAYHLIEMTNLPLQKINKALRDLASVNPSGNPIDPESEWCLGIEFHDRSDRDETPWIQVMGGALNMLYYEDCDPEEVFREKLEGFPLDDFTLSAWNAKLFVTFEMPPEFSSRLADLIDQIAREYFGMPPYYRVEYTVSDFG